MRLRIGFRHIRWPGVLAATAAFSLVAGILAGTLAGSAQSPLVISQKGREFRPATITIKRGDSVEIVNDDLDLRHHAYIDSDAFKYDSGDQAPGSKTKVAFPVAGDFEVLCAIHPKMKLAVHVR